MKSVMWIRTKQGWYVCELRGVCFVTWVNTQDKANAAVFPKDKIDEWVKVISDMTSESLEAVEPFV